jgi:hypothetical protein
LNTAGGSAPPPAAYVPHRARFRASSQRRNRSPRTTLQLAMHDPSLTRRRPRRCSRLCTKRRASSGITPKSPLETPESHGITLRNARITLRNDGITPRNASAFKKPKRIPRAPRKNGNTLRNAGITLRKSESAGITPRNPNAYRKYAIPDKESNPANEHNRVPSKTEQERRSLLDGHSSQQHVELARTLLPQQAVRLRPGAPLDLAGQDTPTKSRTIARRPLQLSQTSTPPKSVGP